VKFTLESAGTARAIQSYGPGRVVVDGEPLTESLVLTPERLLRDWPPQCFEDLRVEHFEALGALGPELVILGSGAHLRFPAPALTEPLRRRGIGLEVMDTGAACRTFNVLLLEERQVALALLMIEHGDEGRLGPVAS
jgi:uncharacterized protein